MPMFGGKCVGFTKPLSLTFWEEKEIKHIQIGIQIWNCVGIKKNDSVSSTDFNLNQLYSCFKLFNR